MFRQYTVLWNFVMKASCRMLLEHCLTEIWLVGVWNGIHRGSVLDLPPRPRHRNSWFVVIRGPVDVTGSVFCLRPRGVLRHREAVPYKRHLVFQFLWKLPFNGFQKASPYLSLLLRCYQKALPVRYSEAFLMWVRTNVGTNLQVLYLLIRKAHCIAVLAFHIWSGWSMGI